MAKILIVDDDIDICKLLDRYLSKQGHEISTTFSGKSALDMVAKNDFDLIFCDFRLKDMDGSDFIIKAHEISQRLKIVIITGYSDVRIAVDVMKRGAVDYVIKPLIPDELLTIIKRTLAMDSTPAEATGNKGTTGKKVSSSATKKQRAEFVKGRSPSAEKMYKNINLVAPTNFSVIIYGESGSGKENVARTIHNLSTRKNAPFIAIDCGALTKELAGSELWGHEKGAFTGALNAKPGQFELASGGTIFLDEISNLSYETQVGLLRLVQERKLRRVGGVKDIDIDVRILVASNENLMNAVQKGRFREDLYYRFNEFTIDVPPLRQLKEDITTFAEHFLDKANEELNKSINGFEKKVLELFMEYSWPGNLREMRNVVRRAALLADGSEITVACLPQEIIYSNKFINKMDEGLEEPENANILKLQISENSKFDLKGTTSLAEAEVLKRVLEETKYNRKNAALKLGIDRKTLFNKMKQYNL